VRGHFDRVCAEPEADQALDKRVGFRIYDVNLDARVV
jgi:hypothetical protein